MVLPFFCLVAFCIYKKFRSLRAASRRRQLTAYFRNKQSIGVAQQTFCGYQTTTAAKLQHRRKFGKTYSYNARLSVHTRQTPTDANCK